MRKFKIFLFIEACLLTGALILMVSEHFSRFLLILFLFLLLIRYYTGKEGNNLLLVCRKEDSLLFADLLWWHN